MTDFDQLTQDVYEALQANHGQVTPTLSNHLFDAIQTVVLNPMLMLENSPSYMRFIIAVRSNHTLARAVAAAGILPVMPQEGVDDIPADILESYQDGERTISATERLDLIRNIINCRELAIAA